MSEPKEKIALEIDYTGKMCFEINFDLRIRIKDIKIGEILKFCTDNPEIDSQISKWCNLNNHELFFSNFENGLYVYYIKRNN